MAIIDTLRGFAESVVSRSSESAIEAAIQAFYADLHELAGKVVPTKQVTTTVTTVETAPVAAPVEPVTAPVAAPQAAPAEPQSPPTV